VNQDPWSPLEKKVARQAFDAALQRELAAVLSALKERAAAAKTSQDVWEIEQYLTGKRREIHAKYDYGYSQLITVFGSLMRDGWLQEQDLIGIAESKLSSIRFLATM